LVISFHGSDLARSAGPLAALARRACHRGDAFVVHSDEMRARALGFGAPANRLLSIPHGVDLDEFTPPADRAGPPLIVGVGRLSEEKGFDLLLAALAKLPTGLDWRCELVGEGPQRAALAELAQRLSLTGRVRFVGPLPPSEVRLRLAAAHLLAAPSRREGFSVVALEAMAAGLPILATTVGALPQLVAADESGVLVKAGDAAELAAALARLLADAELRRRLGAAGRRRAEAYALTRVNAPLVELYRRLVG
jgi:glycosyltransferase involved in cell wall biosynthesis